MTDAKTSQLTSVWAPASQAYVTDRRWTRQADRRIGGDLANTSRWRTARGDVSLNLGGSFQVEDIRPQRGVVTTQEDIDGNRVLRDASRREFSLNGKLEYRPVASLTLWGGGRYSHFDVRDRGVYSTAIRELRSYRPIMVKSRVSGGGRATSVTRRGGRTSKACTRTPPTRACITASCSRTATAPRSACRTTTSGRARPASMTRM